jgi:hypothetical protein
MRKRMFGVLALLLVVAAEGAEAQRCRRYVGGGVLICRRDRDGDEHRNRRWARDPIEFGIRGGYDFDGHQGSGGAQVRLPLVREFALQPSFDAFFGDEGATWQANLDGVIRPPALGGLYVGGGAAFLRREFDPLEGTETKAGWNALLGLNGGHIARSALRPFAEGRWTGVGDFTAFRLVAGVNVPVGGFGR